MNYKNRMLTLLALFAFAFNASWASKPEEFHRKPYQRRSNMFRRQYGRLFLLCFK